MAVVRTIKLITVTFAIAPALMKFLPSFKLIIAKNIAAQTKPNLNIHSPIEPDLISMMWLLKASNAIKQSDPPSQSGFVIQ